MEEFLLRIGFPVTVGYGMTECGPLLTYAGWREHKPQGVGRVVDGMELVVDSDDPARTAGEVKVRGPHVMAGYYKSPEATREVLDENGWLKTGDLGLLDADGFLTLRGRSKTMFLGATGQNVYPEEIEARLNALPFVAESLVVERDHRLHALVYPDLEAADAAHVGARGDPEGDGAEPAEAERTAPSLLPGRHDRDRPGGVPEDPDPEDQAIPLRGARLVGSCLV